MSYTRGRIEGKIRGMQKGRKYRTFIKTINDWLLPMQPFFNRFIQESEGYTLTGNNDKPFSEIIKVAIDELLTKEDFDDIKEYIVNSLNP